MKEAMKAAINLFNALPIEHVGSAKISDALLRETVQRGFVFAPEVIYNYSERELQEYVAIIGLTSEEMNATFHKSWAKVRNADMTQLYLEQIAHYLTTYGFAAMGIYDERSIYIPVEVLNLPGAEKLSLLVINGNTKGELKKKLLDMLQIGVALSDVTIHDVLEIARYVELNEAELATIKNNEVKIVLYDDLGITPANPVEFLRYIIFKCTGKTLLIKDIATVEAIKSGESVSYLFDGYKQQYGLHRLAEIFFRFKPLFLAFRTDSNLKPTINKIRKLADIHHKPLCLSYLDTITSQLARNDKIDNHKLCEELATVNVFRKIRLAYALQYRTNEMDSILYKVRNGKSYATTFEFKNHDAARRTLDVVLDSIIEMMNVKGKRIFIPRNVRYALPATEKQFTGNYPSGSYVTTPHDMVVGIHWKDVNKHRIDLDLSVIGDNDIKTGWDSQYRNNERTILFSGDVTAAPNGATEAFYIQKQEDNNLIMFVNYYNFDSDIEVPFKIMVAQERVTNFNKKYVVNPNNVIIIANSVINQKQKILGLIAVTPTESRFYFMESYLGNVITTGDKEYIKQGRDYLSLFYKNAISLNSVLIKAGAILTDSNENCDIDLSPDKLERNTIISLVNG